MYGGVGKGLVVTLVDRKSRFLKAGLLAGREAAMTRAVLTELLKDVPVRSVSLDNGSEFSESCGFIIPRAATFAPFHKMSWTLLSARSTTAPENTSLGDPLPKFFSLMVLHLLDYLPCSP